MAHFTNTAVGTRGIVMKDGTTTWVEPNQTVDLNKADVDKVHEDIEYGAKETEKVETASADDITAAIGLLDAENDDHWTAGGAPAVDAVAELAGKPVTRKAITEAAPDAKRPAQA